VSYGKAHATLRRRGRVTGQPTDPAITANAVQDLGYTMFLVDSAGKTARTQVAAATSGIYLICTTRHIAASVDGVLHDNPRCSGKRVKCVFRVLPTNEVLTA